MEYGQILTLLTFLLPAASNLICCTVTALDLLTTPLQRERRLKIWLCAFFFTDFFVWINLLFQAFFPEIFFYTQQLWYMALLIDPVMLYLAVRILTPGVMGRMAVRWHITIPLILVALSTLWRIVITENPSGTSLAIGYGDNIIHFNTQIFFEAVFSFTYMALCITSLVKARTELVRNANPAMVRSLNWMRILLPFSIVVLLLPSEVVYFARESEARTVVLFVWVLILVTIHVLSCIKIMRGKYNIAVPAANTAPIDLRASTPVPEHIPVSRTDEEVAEKTGIGTTQRLYPVFTGKLSVRTFDKWFSAHKPYLDQNLKIDDLLHPFGMNRARFSSFINGTYGMSFVNYVGRWRLKELEKLKKNPANGRVPLNVLLGQAGFGSYKSYKRALDYHNTEK